LRLRMILPLGRCVSMLKHDQKTRVIPRKKEKEDAEKFGGGGTTCFLSQGVQKQRTTVLQRRGGWRRGWYSALLIRH